MASATLERLLPGRLSADEVRVSGLRYPVGAGVSNETILFTAECRRGSTYSTEDLVLRVKPALGPDQLFLDPQFASQYELLSELGRAGAVKVPEVLWFDPDEEPFGEPYFIMRQLKGRVPVSMPVYNSTGWLFDASPHERRHLWESAMSGLASIHTVSGEPFGFLAPDPEATGFDQLFAYTHRSFEWAAQGRSFVVPTSHLRWLDDNLPTDRPTGLSWGDARIGNMMFDESFELMAIMDWEQASLGGALQDLGWWLTFDVVHSDGKGLTRLDGLGSRQETLDLWESLTGMKAIDLLWYEVHAAVRLELFPILGSSIEPPEDNVFTRHACHLLDMPPPKELLAKEKSAR